MSKGRYQISVEEDYEPGSNNEVLKNYLGIKSKKEIEALEEQELARTEIELLDIFDEKHQFTATDLCNIHEFWLGDIYPSAGKYRTVNMSKEGFLFAAPFRIESAMQEFEKKYLVKHTPCLYSELDQIANVVGIIHAELILIHPFREGNGRTARLLADLMVMQAKKAPLNYSLIDQIGNFKGFQHYLKAIHASMDGDYQPIQKIFTQLIEGSIQKVT